MKRKQKVERLLELFPATPLLTGKSLIKFKKLEKRNRTKCADLNEVKRSVNTFIGVMNNSKGESKVIRTSVDNVIKRS